MGERSKVLRFGVSEALLVSAVGVLAPGCFLSDSQVTSNPAPLCPDEEVACGEEPGCPCYTVTLNPGPSCPSADVMCGEEEPGCPCYTLNPGPYDMEVDQALDADMDAVDAALDVDADSADLDEDMEPDMTDMLDMEQPVVDS